VQFDILYAKISWQLSHIARFSVDSIQVALIIQCQQLLLCCTLNTEWHCATTLEFFFVASYTEVSSVAVLTLVYYVDPSIIQYETMFPELVHATYVLGLLWSLVCLDHQAVKQLRTRLPAVPAVSVSVSTDPAVHSVRRSWTTPQRYHVAILTLHLLLTFHSPLMSHTSPRDSPLTSSFYLLLSSSFSSYQCLSHSTAFTTQYTINWQRCDASNICIAEL